MSSALGAVNLTGVLDMREGKPLLAQLQMANPASQVF